MPKKPAESIRAVTDVCLKNLINSSILLTIEFGRKEVSGRKCEKRFCLFPKRKGLKGILKNRLIYVLGVQLGMAVSNATYHQQAKTSILRTLVGDAPVRID